MQLSQWIIPIGALLLAAPAASQNFFPLAEGNYWVYQDPSGSHSDTVSVRGAETAGGRIYYTLEGYSDSPVLVRTTESGDLAAFDRKEGREHLLTRFRNQPVPYTTTLFGCLQTANAQTRRVPYSGVAGTFTSALEILYQPVHCRDFGIEQELYLENIGMVRRTVSTIAGPVTFHLVAARVGRLSFSAQPGGEARLTLDRNRVRRSGTVNDSSLTATLRVSLSGSPPLRLRFSSSQRMDLSIRNQDQEIVYSWSADKLFLAVQQDETLSTELSYSVEALIPATVPDGEYQVEAWLTTRDGAQFAASTVIRLDGITLYYPD